jgi:hypothetical protein
MKMRCVSFSAEAFFSDDFFIYLASHLFTWTWSNLCILACIAACIGQMFRPKYQKRSMSRSLVNGVIAYLFTLLSAFVFTGELPPSLYNDVKKQLEQHIQAKHHDEKDETEEISQIRICEEIEELKWEGGLKIHQVIKADKSKRRDDILSQVKQGTISASVEEYIRFAIIVSLLSCLLNSREGLLRQIIAREFDRYYFSHQQEILKLVRKLSEKDHNNK